MENKKRDLTDFELTINNSFFWDYDISSDYFNDNFEILKYSSYRDTSILYFKDYGNISNFEIDFNLLTKKDILNILNDDSYKISLKKDELIQALYDCFVDDLAIFFELDCTLLYKLGFEIHVSRGYSQGDYSKIIINVKEWEKIGGSKFNINEMGEYFDHLLWDAPVRATIEFSFNKETADGFNLNFESEFYLDEWLSDSYDIGSFDSNEVLENIIKSIDGLLSGEQIETIKSFLDSIDYDMIKNN